MRPFTQTELKAMDWYMNEHGLRLKLSQPPTIYFQDDKGEEHKRRLEGILLDYKNRKDKKELS